MALETQVESNHGDTESARHARLILLLAAGHTWADIRARLGCSDSYIARWSKRFAAERLAGLYTRHAGRGRYKVTDKLERRVLDQTTQRTPADGSRYWSSRKLAAELGGAISYMTVTRIWAKHGIKPHRLKSLLAPTGPDFNASAADIVGLYLDRTQHAAIFCRVDHGAAHKRSESVDLPPCKGRPGMPALCRALTGRPGEVAGTARSKRPAAAELTAFLVAVVAHVADGKETHIITDRAGAGRSHRLASLLAARPELHLHLTYTFASWIAQVDCTLGKIELAFIAFNPAHHAPKLKNTIMRAIRRCNQRSVPLKWSHLDQACWAGGLCDPDAAR
ncbi:hypothetical protein ATSB10_23550 [Dyella thiooxydans]|uniref:Transposase n=2 Tax=Dyella thiooxydans TaxID=445710 RepID=A0A161J7N8_9GAMM|nr:hypothetical protein ATSB10_23550 [Dyella thiooxydans]